MIQFLILILLLGCGEHIDVCEIKKEGSSLELLQMSGYDILTK